MVKGLLAVVILWLAIASIVGYTAKVALGETNHKCPEDAVWIFEKCTPVDDFGVCRKLASYSRVFGTYGAKRVACNWQREHLGLWR